MYIFASLGSSAGQLLGKKCATGRVKKLFFFSSPPFKQQMHSAYGEFLYKKNQKVLSYQKKRLQVQKYTSNKNLRIG